MFRPRVLRRARSRARASFASSPRAHRIRVMILVDTNVVSVVMAPRPRRPVTDWLNRQEATARSMSRTGTALPIARARNLGRCHPEPRGPVRPGCARRRTGVRPQETCSESPHVGLARRIDAVSITHDSSFANGHRGSGLRLASASSTNSPQTMIDTRLSQYQITAKLGEGGMGEVYRATHLAATRSGDQGAAEERRS